MIKYVDTVKQLKQFMKADEYEYEANDIEMVDGKLLLRFTISTNKQCLCCKTDVNCTPLPIDYKKYKADNYDTMESFLDKLENEESFKDFLKKTLGKLYNRNLSVTGFCLCEEKEEDNYEYIGMAVFDFDTKTIKFIEE